MEITGRISVFQCVRVGHGTGWARPGQFTLSYSLIGGSLSMLSHNLQFTVRGSNVACLQVCGFCRWRGRKPQATNIIVVSQFPMLSDHRAATATLLTKTPGEIRLTAMFQVSPRLGGHQHSRRCLIAIIRMRTSR